jgi:hypothetical protein
MGTGSTALAERADGFGVAPDQVRPGSVPHFLFRDQKQIPGRKQQTFVPSKKLLGPAPDPASLDGIPDLPARDHGHSGVAEVIGEMDQIEIFSPVAAASFIKLRKIGLFADPLLRKIAFAHQTARRFRPFCRLRLITFCPPGVLMRTKNP